MRSSWLAGLAVLGLLIAFRCLGAAFPAELPNFSPLVAIFLCCVTFFRGPLAWLLPLAAWLLSNPLASLLQGYKPFGADDLGPTLTALATLLVIGLLALPLRARPTAPLVLGAGLGAAALFHLATGVAAWITFPPYPSGPSGLWQALWSGYPGAELPSWVFLRNLAAANLAFTAFFLLARRPWRSADAPLAAAPQTR